MHAPRPPKQRQRGGSGGFVALLLSPAALAVSTAQAFVVALHSAARDVLSLPVRLLVACLYFANATSGDLLAYLTAQPTSKMQLERQRQALSTAQQRLGAQQRLVEDLQREVDALRADRRKLQRRNVELAARLEQAEEEVKAAAADADGAKGGAWQQRRGGGGGGGGAADPGPRWALHAAVAAAAVGVRWWLVHETDPVQRKIMLVILWPAAWIYASMLLGCLPAHTPGLRRAFLAMAYVICGYVARAAAERSLGAAAGAAQQLAARWQHHHGDLLAFASHHLHPGAAGAAGGGAADFPS